MSDEQTYRSLVDCYESTKRDLNEAENTIRRITGRDPDDVLNDVSGAAKYRPSSFSVSERISYPGRKRAIYTKGECSPEYPVSEESSPDESPIKKPSLPSRVVAKTRLAKSRKATIEEQNANSKIKARNRRMFGALIGTLEKFQSEEKKRQHVVSMKTKKEQKVEAATEEERKKIKKEKETLFVTRREKQVQLRCLEKKIERAESHEVFDRVHKKMCNFIKTAAEPPIFYLPVTHTAVSAECFEDSKKLIKVLVDKKKAELLADLAEIEESYRRSSEMVSTIPDDKDNLPKGENEYEDVPETESESLMVEQEDIALEEAEVTIDMNLADSVSEEEFEPIYD